MDTLTLKHQIMQQLDRLSPEQQRRVLDFASSLTRPRGESGRTLIEAARQLDFSPDDLAEMEQAIEEDCEMINPDAW